jgi:hypothetical protein
MFAGKIARWWQTIVPSSQIVRSVSDGRKKIGGVSGSKNRIRNNPNRANRIARQGEAPGDPFARSTQRLGRSLALQPLLAAKKPGHAKKPGQPWII